MLLNSIRVPEVQGLGIQHTGDLLTVALLKARSDKDIEIMSNINKEIDKYNTKLSDIRKEYSNSLVQNSQKAIWDPKQTYSNIQHASMFGSFSVASFFTSKGFGLADELSKIRNIDSHQFIIGSVPVPISTYQQEFKIIQQNTNFITSKKEDIVQKHPIVAICQLQNNSVINTSMAGVLLLPLMKAIDVKLLDTIDQIDGFELESINATLIDTYNWCDSCLILRGNNFNVISECLKSISSISFQDIFDAWQELKEISDLKIIEIGKYSFERIDRVLNLLLKKSEFDYKPYDATQSNNHVFSQTLTFLGIFDPFIRNCCLDKTEDWSQNDWDIGGNVFAQTLLKIRPGHDDQVQSLVYNFSLEPQFKDICHYDVSSYLYGKTDILVSWHLKGQDEEGNAVIQPCSAIEMIKGVYRLRYELFKKSHSPGIDSCSVEGTFTQIDGCLIAPQNIISQEDIEKNEILAVSKIFENVFYTTIRCKGLIQYLKKRHVHRALRKTLSNVLSLWREKLIDYSLFNQMVELSDIYIPWLSIIEHLLDDKDEIDLKQIEEAVKFFTVPFTSSIRQRYLRGSDMMELGDITSEYKGGLSTILTGIDGLAKSCMALMSDPKKVGIVSIINHDSVASINIYKYFNDDLKDEYNLAVANINRSHFIYPFKITTFLHEIIHVVVQSNDFYQTIKGCENGEMVLTLLTRKKEDDSEGFLSNRLDEILAEYILGFLLFKDNPSLYAKMYLSKCVLQSEFFDSLPNKQKYYEVKIEHILRAFCVYSMLKISEKYDDLSLEQLSMMELYKTVSHGFKEWWAEHFKFVENNYDEDFSKFLHKILLSGKWLNNIEMLVSLQNFIISTNKYFSISDNNQKDDEENIDTHLRRTFFATLQQTMSTDLNEVKELLSNSHETLSEGAHFDFTGAGYNDNVRSLRVRRLESFIGYLLIIRAFHEIIDEWINSSGSDCLIVERENDTGKVKFIDGNPYSAVAFDKAWGTIFIFDDEHLSKYLNLRFAIIKSIWHLGEITKHSDMMNLLDLELNEGQQTKNAEPA